VSLGRSLRPSQGVAEVIDVKHPVLEQVPETVANHQVHQGSPERRVQLTDEFSDPPTATWGDRVAPQDVHHDGMREDPRLRDVVGSDCGIVSGGEFERSCGMGGRSEDVLDLRSFCQWVEERRTGRVAGRARSVARRSLSCIAGLLSRPVCRPGAVT
jgi:hypothetical protein